MCKPYLLLSPRIIDNNVKSFEEKIEKTYKHICKLLEIPEIPTYHKKYLLSKEIQVEDVPEEAGPESFVEKVTFLNSASKDRACWLKSRKAESGAISLGFVDRKISDDKSERLELLRKVHPTLYSEYLTLRHPEMDDVEKSIIQFIWKNKSFNVESYTNRHGNRVTMLRVFVDQYEDKIEFPDFLEVQEDISRNPKYFLHNIANPKYDEKEARRKASMENVE